MNEPDDLLGFLIEGLVGQHRDIVTRAFYKTAEGDPNSGPVNEAILFTAVSRRMALAPKELREANAEFKQLLAGGREMEARIRERVELSNAGVVASFKDEVARATSYLRASAQHNEEIITEGRQIAETMKAHLVQDRELLTELREIKTELKMNRDANQQILKATENNKSISQSIKEIVEHLTDMASMNWITIGVFIGSILAIIAMQLPWWLALLLFALAIGLLQAMARLSCKLVSGKAETMKTVD
jgi:F0F1-type ATP synthase assembly protein I